MNPRASELINQLDLKHHPEGGYFREVFRSGRLVKAADSQEELSAVTEIYFLLTAGEFSRLHRISRDELWHYYEGADLELFWIDEERRKYHACLLGGVRDERRPFAAIPAGCWQGARTTGEYTLVGCTVAPGFDFSDFRLLRNDPEEAKKIKSRFPGLAMLI